MHRIFPLFFWYAGCDLYIITGIIFIEEGLLMKRNL